MDKQLIYILKHKDINVLKFSFNKNFEIDKIYEIYEKNHIPVGVYDNQVMDLKDSLQYWWKHRSIPASRNNLENKLKLLNVSGTSELLNKSYGLSLTDHYWIMPEDKLIKWKDINFYENDFSSSIGKVLFDNINILPNDFSFNSPDNSSDGNLQKKWAIEKNGTRILIKGGDIFSPQEAFNEVIVSKIYELLDLPHVNYKIIEDKNKKVFYSKSQNFTSEKIEFINANHIISCFREDKSKNKYEHFIDCCQKIGINRNLFEKDLVNMFFIDYIVANKDRHYRNFGFLRDSQSLKWIGLAPVYDTGNSLFEGLADIDLHDNFFNNSKNILAKPFAENQKEQINILPINKFCKDINLKKLEPLYDYIQNLFKINYRMSNDRKTMINKLLKERITEAEKFQRNFSINKRKSTDYDFSR